MRGGIHIISAYLYVNEGLSSRNRRLLEVVASIIRCLRGLWALAADFNFTPGFLRRSGFLQLVRGEIAAPVDPTCNDHVYDYFVVPRRLAPSVVAVQVVHDEGVHPHRPVRLLLRANLHRVLLTKILRPKPVGALACVLGPAPPPPRRARCQRPSTYVRSKTCGLGGAGPQTPPLISENLLLSPTPGSCWQA